MAGSREPFCLTGLRSLGGTGKMRGCVHGVEVSKRMQARREVEELRGEGRSKKC